MKSTVQMTSEQVRALVADWRYRIRRDLGVAETWFLNNYIRPCQQNRFRCFLRFGRFRAPDIDQIRARFETRRMSLAWQIRWTYLRWPFMERLELANQLETGANHGQTLDVTCEDLYKLQGRSDAY